MKRNMSCVVLCFMIMGSLTTCYLIPKEINPNKFAVVSDIHYYDPELGTKGTAFQGYTDNDGIPDTPDWDGYYTPAATLAAQQEVVAGITVSMLLVDAFVAHYAGIDRLALIEEPEQTQLRAILACLLASDEPLYATLGTFMYALWSDPAPEDNVVSLFLD